MDRDNLSVDTENNQLNHLNDVFVKFIFFDEARKKLTLSLINAFFQAEGTPSIVDFTFQDREPDPDSPGGKQPRLDVLGVCSDGTIVEIEFQNLQVEGMADRVLFYWARLAQKRSRGVGYANLPRIACINILGYKMFPDLPDYHNCYMVINTRHAESCLSHRLELHFAEVPKWEEQCRHTRGMDQLSRWLMFFSEKTTPEELEELAMQDEMIAQALDAERAFLANEELMSAYEWAEKDRLDREAHQSYWENKGREEGFQEGLDEGRKEGHADGLEEGRKEGHADGFAEGCERVAKNLISMHLPDEMIIEATGLSAEVVASLRSSHAQMQ